MPRADPSSLAWGSDAGSSIDQILKHLPLKATPVLTLLKGHLLVEETLRSFVARKLVNDRSFCDAQLSFHQLCCMTRALYDPPGFELIWDAIKYLNRLRNDLAHHLEPVGFEERIEEFQDLVDSATVVLNPGDMQEQMGRLALTFATLIAFIHIGLETDLPTAS